MAIEGRETRVQFSWKRQQQVGWIPRTITGSEAVGWIHPAPVAKSCEQGNEISSSIQFPELYI